MALVFTDYVRSLTPGEQLPAAGFDAVWEKLRDVLVSEMRKRSLWQAAPSYLGVYGRASWLDPGALDELTIDCFKSAVLSRLPSLQGLLAVQDNVEGVIFRNVRYFLYELQKRYDPLGFVAFDALRNAAQRLIDVGKLQVLDGSGRIDNDTVLGFPPAAAPEDVPDVRLDAPARGWAESLLPDLVTAKGDRRLAVEEALAAALAKLAGEGVEVFRFRDALDPLKNEVRSCWGAIWEHSQGDLAFEDDGEAAALVRLVRPDSGYEERQAFQQLLACMAEQLAHFDSTRKTREQLGRLWEFLRCEVAENPGEKPLSRRRVADLLEIHRSRLAELFRKLGALVEACRGRQRRQEAAA
jgi:hypothetical protein